MTLLCIVFETFLDNFDFCWRYSRICSATLLWRFDIKMCFPGSLNAVNIEGFKDVNSEIKV